MELSLSLKNNSLLTQQERNELDKEIDNIIAEQKANAYQINQLVFDSVNALTISEARSYELQAQSALKRLWGGITGKNRKLQSDIDRNLARAQYCSQQTIQKLAEQNLMSFELITAVNNKLNSSIIEIDNEINNIYTILIKFFKQSKSDIIQIENRLDKVEKNLNLLNWINSIEYQMVNGIEYSELDDMEKILRLAVDFYAITKENWTTSDLLLLKSAIANIGLSPRDDIRYIDFIKHICKNENLYDIFMNAPVELLEKIDNTENTITDAIIKYKLLDTKENYIVETINEVLNFNEIKEDVINLKYLIIKKYEEQKHSVDIYRDINIFDFVLELLFNMSILNNKVNDLYNNFDFSNVGLEELIVYASKYGNARAQYLLGIRYTSGDGINKNIEEGMKWLTVSAKQGYIHAQSSLGLKYAWGVDVEKNVEEGIKWLNLAIEQGDVGAQYNLADIYYYGDESKEKDYIKAERLYLPLAEQGNYLAQFSLGEIYDCGGYGVEQNYESAVKWLYKASVEHDYELAQEKLGNMYYWGNGVKQDYQEAAKWYKLSANKGWLIAQNSIGNMYRNGLGVEQDYNEAIKWYKLSAEQGYGWAEYNMADMYYNGYGVEQNYNEAIKWFKSANNYDAQNRIANMYYNGYGVEQDYKEAVKWYKLSEEQGYDWAEYNLANMYYEGKGVMQDYQEARRLYKLSAEQGNDDAKEKLRRYFNE